LAPRRFLRSAPNAEDEGRRTRLTVLLLVVFAVSQVFMFGVMVWRYPMVYDFTDHRLWYFPWPFQALLVFGLLVLLRRVFPRLPARQRALVDAALVLVAVANVAAWPRDRQISLHSQWFPKIHDPPRRRKTPLRDG